MSISESRRILRRLELEAYACVVTALRAQGHLSLEKKSVLSQLSQQLSISTERHHAEVRRAICDDDLCYIADCVSGTESRDSWLPEAKRLGRGNPKLVARHSLSSSTQAQALTAFGLSGTRLGGVVNAKTDHTESTTDKKLPLQVQSALKIVLANHPNAANSAAKPKVQVTTSIPSPAPPPAPPIPSPAPTPSPSTAPVSSPVAVVMCSIGSQTDPPIPPPTHHTDSVGIQVDFKCDDTLRDGMEPENKAIESLREVGVVNKVTEEGVDPLVDDSQTDTPMEVGVAVVGVSEVIQNAPALHTFLSSGDPVILKDSPLSITKNAPLKRLLDNESIDTPPSKIPRTDEKDDSIGDDAPSNIDHTPLSHDYSVTDMSESAVPLHDQTVSMVTEADQSVNSKPPTPATTIPLDIVAPPIPPSNDQTTPPNITTPAIPVNISATLVAPPTSPPTNQKHVPVSITLSKSTASQDTTPTAVSTTTAVSMATALSNTNIPITVASSISQVSSTVAIIGMHDVSTVMETTPPPVNGHVVGSDRSDSSFNSQSNPEAMEIPLATEPVPCTSSVVIVPANDPLKLDKPIIPDTIPHNPSSIQSPTAAPSTIPILSSDPLLQSTDQPVSPLVTPFVSVPSITSFEPLSIPDPFSSSISTLDCSPSKQSDLIPPVSVTTALTSFLPIDSVSPSVLLSTSSINTQTSSVANCDSIVQSVPHDFTSDIDLGTPSIETTTEPYDLIPPSIQPLPLSINTSTIIETPSLVPPTLIETPVIDPLAIIQPPPHVPPTLGITPTINPSIIGPPSVDPPSIHSIFSFPSPLVSTSVLGNSPLCDSSSSLAGTPIDDGDLLATVTSELGVDSIDPSLLNMSDLLSFLPSDDMTLEDLALTGGEISSDMVVLQEGVGGVGKTPVDFGGPSVKLEGFGGDSAVVATTPESILEDVPLEIKDTVEAILKSQTNLDTI